MFRQKLTLDISVHNAMFMKDIDGCSDLFTVESDDMLLQSQSGHLLQSALIAVLHKDVHLLLQFGAQCYINHSKINCKHRKKESYSLPDGAQHQSSEPGLGV